ncbi:BTAD domain-containing putative transcriptional regulator [Nocardia sp. NPDC051981]|uniref:BTAD domain-containing putative transcriptional regulator n=1 Tax=Nocardia sp. NPDC051981 TaxID=3155417 RepID=UPI003415CF2F
MIRISLLGAAEVISGDGVVVEVRGARLSALLAVLALEAGTVVPVSRLVDAVWGEQLPVSPENSLQTLVKRLRAITGQDAVVWAEPGYLLAVEPEAVDAIRFARLVDAGRDALSEGRPDDAVAALDRALGLCRGPALGDAVETAALRVAAEVLAERRLTAVELHADAFLALGRAAEVVRGLAAESAAHPFRESLAARLVTALAAAGRTSDAVQEFRRIERLLRTERGVEPSAVLRRAVPELDLPPEPPGVARDVPASPRRLTSFVGRVTEVPEIAGMLQRHRLVTLVGPGGIGKTRLATELVLAHPGQWPDGVAFAELSAVTPERPGARVRNAIAAAVFAAVAPGVITDEPGQDWIDLLVRRLGRRRMLLIVDNCEHVISAVADLVVSLLDRLPLLTVLATSRQLLAVDCEQLYPVRPMPIPAAGVTVEEAAASTAVRLFLDRAVAVRPDFQLSEDNCHAIAAVVRSLDGVPLALELAAARLHGLSPQALADRLDDRFGLLTNGSRRVIPRHRSLRAMVAWSWELLPAAEAELARRLSVFVGGATLDAVTGVCGTDMDDAETLTDRLAALVSMSLVEFDGERYRMLDTIRAYATAELARAGETERWEHAHAAWFVEFSAVGARELGGPAQHEWLHRFAAEHGNCEAALAWAVRHQAAEFALRLFGDRVWYWLLRGQRTQLSAWQSEVLAVAGERIPPGCTGSFLMCRYAAHFPEPTMGVKVESFSDASAEFEQLIRVAMSEPRGVHYLFVLVLALREHHRGDRSLLDCCAAADDGRLRGHALVLRAFEDIDANPITRTFADLEQAVDCLSESGDPRTLGFALFLFAYLRVTWHGIACAAPLLIRAAGLLNAELGADVRLRTLTYVANLHLAGGDIAGAAGYLASAERIDIAEQTAFTATARCLTLGYLAWREGRTVRALELFDQVFAATQPITDHRSFARMFEPVHWRVTYAYVLLDAGRMESAAHHLRIARDYAVSTSPLMLLNVAFGHAMAALASGQADRAARIIGILRREHVRVGRTVLGPDGERVVTLARNALGDTAFEALAGEGDDTALEALLVEVEHVALTVRGATR